MQLGVGKGTVPIDIMTLLNEEYSANSHQSRQEEWGVRDVHVNHWTAPTYKTDMSRHVLKAAMEKLKPTVENW